MLEAIILFGPAVLASVIYCKLRGMEAKTREVLIYSAIFAFLINSFVIGILYLRGHTLSEVRVLFLNVGVATKYCALALLAAVTIPNALNLAVHVYSVLVIKGRRRKV